MLSAITAACDAAFAKSVALLPGAEEETTNPGIEKWNRILQRRYNPIESGRATVYTTYQCYLKSAPRKLMQHLQLARTEGYVAGVKLVRGAYLASEPCHLIWDTKEETDQCYDTCVEALLWQSYAPLDSVICRLKSHNASKGAEQGRAKSSVQGFPATNIVLATHNHASVRTAVAARNTQAAAGKPLSPLVYAQLQGMADEISQELVQAGLDAKGAGVRGTALGADPPRVVKCMSWGPKKECLNYLLRRAAENQDAALRTLDTRREMGKELRRRLLDTFRLV